MSKPRYRLSIDAALREGAQVVLRDNPAHYLAQVLRLGVGDAVSLFNRTDGEWTANLAEVKKKEVHLAVEACTRPPAPPLNLTVCFAPIKGGRMETIIEKATELGAAVLQPVLTARTIVDRINPTRAEAIAREAAEQCERLDWPEIREPAKLLKLLGHWPADMPLIYGDETGGGASITQLPPHPQGSENPHWGILAGPEGGFTPEEFAALRRLKSGVAVGLGPRILRADTAVITLCVCTLERWGDWNQPPRFTLRGDT